MTISDLVRGLRRHLVLLAIAPVLGVVVAQLITMLQSPTYESKASVFFSLSQTTDRLDQAYQGTLLSQQKVRSYADIVTTPTVTEPVLRELGLRMRPDTLAKRLSVEVPLDTALLNVSASASSPVMAARIVNSVTRHLAKAVSDLEGPQAGRPWAIQIHVVRPGAVPAEPSSPKPMLNIIIGLVLGVIAGIAAGALKDALDTRIGQAADVSRIKGLAVLGEVPREFAARRHVLADDTDRFGKRAEAYRKLRTNLRFIGVDRPPRTIVISSPHRGDGKSSTALNVAFSLADDGARVVLVDADLRRSSIAASLGLVEGAGLTSVLAGQAKIADVVQQAKRRSTIKVVTSGPVPPNPSELLGTRRMQQVLEELREHADYVIVDSPPLLPVADAAVVASGCDGVILVARAGRTKYDELRSAAESLAAVNAETLGVVVNMTKPSSNDRYYRYISPGRVPGARNSESPVPRGSDGLEPVPSAATHEPTA
ncbi:polysaccharide biosynthesis tyrosine autokinase [Actinoallomurus rhizosphaericola]|uniref:polysaccharide biosynthesis tyrosine autokinase n=1 Tax=Actinoallomurus rhizosphaericola TaxID=2952536 RepID=UPI00209293BD|nr:polysaccharide biosynthesis tyrosine autokinase [Actinoallomurus rhizosphaericola]MCO5998414.1 polysaccharide biosynthesis tyrosine autokinase [Actinoallomurus rhizosphaericola]